MEKIEDICISSITAIISSMASDPSLYAMKPGKDFTRNRVLPFDKLLWGIMAMEGNSLNKELFDIFNNTSDKQPFISKSAFVQQRNKLKHEAFQKLFNDFNGMTSVYDDKRLSGYRLLAIDDSDINIALNPGSDTYFGPECSHFNGEGFNQFHLNTMYDLLNCVYTDAVIQPGPKEHEVEAARIMVKRFQPDDKNIVLADRGYASLDLMATIRDMGADFLFRVPNGFLVELKNMPMTDFDINLEFTIVTDQHKDTKKLREEGKVKWLPGPSKFGKPKKNVRWFHSSPYLMKLRVVRFQLETGDYETIVTSLSREEFSPDLMKDLYHKRWGIETSFRELKYAIGLTSFHAKKEESIKQEIFARLLVYNFCSRITNAVVIEQKDENIYEYQVNFTQAVHICLCFLKGRLDCDIRDSIRKHIEPIRPGRKDKAERCSLLQLQSRLKPI